jgi:hypothetical protein
MILRCAGFSHVILGCARNVDLSPLNLGLCRDSRLCLVSHLNRLFKVKPACDFLPSHLTIRYRYISFPISQLTNSLSTLGEYKNTCRHKLLKAFIKALKYCAQCHCFVLFLNILQKQLTKKHTSMIHYTFK